MENPIAPDYLGDAVYATHKEGNVIMLTTNHHNPSYSNDTIYLEPEVMKALVRYATRAGILPAAQQPPGGVEFNDSPNIDNT